MVGREESSAAVSLGGLSDALPIVTVSNQG